MKNKQIVFTQKNVAEFLETDIGELAPDEVLVKTAVSTISCGTEKANITGQINNIASTDDTVTFPRYGGYSSTGVVVAKGDAVKSVEIGDRVAMYWSVHAQYNKIKEEFVVKIEYDNVSMSAAALCHIGTFPMAAIRKTELEIGESMLVMGLGVLGLLAVSFARFAGAVPIIAVDPVPERREKALAMGADYALDPFAPDFVGTVKRLSGGGVETAIEVTGVGAGLNQCLDCMRRFGRVALLGCTRDKNFTVDYYRRVHGPGIKLIGAHTLARPQLESSPHAFTQRDDMKSIMKLIAMGRINLDEVIDEVGSPADCVSVYDRLINDKNFPSIYQFDWSKI